MQLLHWPFDMTRTMADVCIGLQQEQMPLYESLTKVLDPSEQQILQGVIHEAEARSIAAQQGQRQAQIAAAAQNQAAPALPGS